MFRMTLSLPAAGLFNISTIKLHAKPAWKKQRMRRRNDKLDKTLGEVKSANCSSPAGKSGYCNHVMALLFELADYSLNQLKHIPEEIHAQVVYVLIGYPLEKCV